MPPSNSTVVKLKKKVTSFERVLERESIEDPKTFLRASSKATLILVEINE
jgi:hypothetical protein